MSTISDFLNIKTFKYLYKRNMKDICDDPTLIDRYPEYNTDKHIGYRPPTPTQQREDRYKLKASKKKVICPQHLIRSVGR